MTVALAFKAFAKASPCLTPFLATADPSVLMRILAYIRGLPCSRRRSSSWRLKTTPLWSSGIHPGGRFLLVGEDAVSRDLLERGFRAVRGLCLLRDFARRAM